MSATPETFGKKAFNYTMIMSLVYPFALQFLLAPFAYLTGLFSRKELIDIIFDLRICMLLISTLIFAVVLQYRTWIKFDTHLHEQPDPQNLGDVLTRHFLKTAGNFFLIICWQTCMALLGIGLFFNLEMGSLYVYVPLGTTAFGMIFGSIVLTEIYTKTEKYFCSLYPEFVNIHSLSIKILIMVGGLLSGTVVLFTTANDWADKAQGAGITLPICLTASNSILSVTALGFTAYVIYRLISEANTHIDGFIGSIKKIKEKEKESEYLKKQMEQSVLRFKKLFSNLQDAVDNKQYDRRIQPESEYDDLALSLNDVLITLEQAEIERTSQNWLKNGLAELSRVITGERNIYRLTSRALSFIAGYCNATTGTIFVLDEETKDFFLTAGHALKQGKFFNSRFKPGQGIAGEAVAQMKTVVITDVPDNYIHIESSLVTGLPRCIIIVPLINENQVVGVLELGSLETFTELETDFLESVGKTLATAINAIILNQQFSALASTMDRRKSVR